MTSNNRLVVRRFLAFRSSFTDMLSFSQVLKVFRTTEETEIHVEPFTLPGSWAIVNLRLCSLSHLCHLTRLTLEQWMSLAEIFHTRSAVRGMFQFLNAHMAETLMPKFRSNLSTLGILSRFSFSIPTSRFRCCWFSR